MCTLTARTRKKVGLVCVNQSLPASFNDGYVTREANAQQAEAAGERTVHEHTPPTSQRSRHSLPRSTVYLSMRRLATTNDVEGVIGRALKREKDGVLEAPQQSTAVIFLDDVHLSQEV